jgi:hypothetical protein
MTPKGKAQYLFDIYTNYVGEYDIDKHAKQCALIAVDEVLSYSKAHGFIGLTEYWEEVKQEIEKL